MMRKMGARLVVVEEHRQPCKTCALGEEIADIVTVLRQPRADAVAVYRASFWACSKGDFESGEASAADDLLGYLVVVNVSLAWGRSVSYVLDSVMAVPSRWYPCARALRQAGPVEGVDQPRATGDRKEEGCRRPILNSYFHACREFDVEIAGRQRETIRGSYFCQKNYASAMCAHAALRMTLINAGLAEPAELTYVTINRTLGLYGKRFLPRGLTDDQVEQFADGRGLAVDHLRCFDEQERNYPFVHFLYSALESGLPALLNFTTDDPRSSHVVSVVGHTLSTNAWPPRGDLYSRADYKYLEWLGAYESYQWMDKIVIHDDNYGPFLELPTDYLAKKAPPETDPTLRVKDCFRFSESLPVYRGYEIDVCAAALTEALLAENPTENEWVGKVLAERHVQRTFEIGREQYLNQLANCVDWEDHHYSQADIQWLRNNCDLPVSFWMVEFSLADLYTTNQTKVGEMLFARDKELLLTGPADVRGAAWHAALFVRMPDWWAVPDRAANVLRYRTGMQLVSHVRLFAAREMPLSESY